MLIECVPNFSEGRDRAVIDAIAAVISGSDGIELLDVDPGEATNRTVVTFVGGPEGVEEAAFRAIRTAAELIDMTKHEGEHPRMGATDVCPFVPMAGASMDDCVAIARRLGRRVGDELGIPVYLYEHAADTPEPLPLSTVRKGEYEGLADREDAPDFGPAHNARTGATAIGAREFLIAYNVNLNTRSRKLANEVAFAVRETGRLKRDADGAVVRDDEGTALRVPGRFRHVRGVGWYIEEYGRAQVSLNLTNYRAAPMHEVFDACVAEAAKHGMRVTGSELVGLIPREAMLAAGDHYLTKQGRTTGVAEAERIHTAVMSLGLDDLGPFDPAAKIVEYRYRGTPAGLVDMTVRSLADELSSESVAPGGGSVAALCGSLAAALTSMVAALTYAKTGMEEVRPRMGDLGVRAQELKDWFLAAVDRDTAAYDAVIAARRLPRGTSEEQAARDAAIAAADEEATRVPLEVAQWAVVALELARDAVRHGNPASITDAGVGALCALAAAEGAGYNVAINLPSLGEPLRKELGTAAEDHVAAARVLAAEVRQMVEDAIG